MMTDLSGQSFLHKSQENKSVQAAIFYSSKVSTYRFHGVVGYWFLDGV